MGRVYEALKRAAQSDAKESRADAAPREETRANGANGNGTAHATADAARTDALFAGNAAYFNAPDGRNVAAHGSAPTEHTIEAHAGSALPGGAAARVAGATVDAGGSTRAATYTSVEVVTSRVEPHLVSITNPRSPHAEQYRSLRTRILHAGERRKVQAVVITSAGVGPDRSRP